MPRPAQIIYKENFTDIPGTFRASSVAQMWKVYPEINLSTIPYKLGRPETNYSSNHTVQNQTASHNIQISLVLPEFLTTSIPFPLILAPNASATFSIVINEPLTKNYSPRTYPGSWSISALPLNVNGPVSVLYNVQDNSQTVELFWFNAITGERVSGTPPIGWVSIGGNTYKPQEEISVEIDPRDNPPLDQFMIPFPHSRLDDFMVLQSAQNDSTFPIGEILTKPIGVISDTFPLNEILTKPIGTVDERTLPINEFLLKPIASVSEDGTITSIGNWFTKKFGKLF